MSFSLMVSLGWDRLTATIQFFLEVFRETSRTSSKYNRNGLNIVTTLEKTVYYKIHLVIGPDCTSSIFEVRFFGVTKCPNGYYARMQYNIQAHRFC